MPDAGRSLIKKRRRSRGFFDIQTHDLDRRACAIETRVQLRRQQR